ncbi:MAG: LysE family transporter [Acidimicrobiia bacterium]
MEPFLEGIFVGLGIAVPVGVLSLLVMDLGVRRGFTPAMAAGTGVSTSYLIYAIVPAVIASVASSFVVDNSDLLLLIGGLILVTYGLVGLYRFRTRTEPEERPEDRSIIGTYFVFVGVALSQAGPLVYFSAAILGRAGELITSGGDKISYLFGIIAAALVWNAVLAAYSGSTNHYLPAGGRVLTRLVGSLIVLLLGMRFVLDVF